LPSQIPYRWIAQVADTARLEILSGTVITLKIHFQGFETIDTVAKKFGMLMLGIGMWRKMK
jgi:hypothetical protein